MSRGLGLAGIAMTILTAVVPMSEPLRWLLAAIAVILFVVAIIVALWPRLHPITPARTKIEPYTDEELNRGVNVFVPPAAAVEIPIKLKKGEHIQIQINSVASQDAMEHHIDSMLLDRHRKNVLGWDCSTDHGYSVLIPLHKSALPPDQPKIYAGQHSLRLSNEYQNMLEKQLRIKVSRRPYAGSITITCRIDSIRWDLKV